MGSDKISTSLVDCECVKAKIGKALHADGSPHVEEVSSHARTKGFPLLTFPLGSYFYHNLVLEFI